MPAEPILSPDGQHVWDDDKWIPWNQWEAEQERLVASEPPLSNGAMASAGAADVEEPPDTPAAGLPDPGAEPRTPFWRNWWVAGVAVVAVGVVLALAVLVVGRDLLTKARPKHAISGSITVNDGSALWDAGAPCSGQGGYDDIQAGTSVVIYNGSGSIIGTGQLQAGVGGEALFPGGTSDLANKTGTCTFAFSIAGVPDSAFYKVEVSHRGGLTFSRAEMQANAWTVASTLG